MDIKKLIRRTECASKAQEHIDRAGRAIDSGDVFASIQCLREAANIVNHSQAPTSSECRESIKQIFMVNLQGLRQDLHDELVREFGGDQKKLEAINLMLEE